MLSSVHSLSALLPRGIGRRTFQRGIRVLGIESSCDDTGVAVVSHDKKILAEALHSQGAIHREYGNMSFVAAKIT